MRKLFAVVMVMALCLLMVQCTKDKQEKSVIPSGNSRPETDSALFEKIILSKGFQYYGGKDSVYPSARESAHKAYFRVRFNQIAQAALSDNGKLPVGGSFPPGSIIVKELHGNQQGTSLQGYAIMEKLPDDINAAKAWVWAEYTSTAKPVGISIAEKGAACVSCHTSNSRDYVRLFNLFP